MPEFNRASARRIADGVLQRERTPRNKALPRTEPKTFQTIYDAMVTTAVTARSGTTKGAGVVTLYVDDRTGTGNMVSCRTGVPVWNVYGASVATGKWVKVCLTDGKFSLLGSDC